jgi:hypothetical protein
MTRSTAASGRMGRRGLALVGLSGAILTAVGDVLILGRSCSGAEFDQAAGVIPPHIDATHRWRSLWNGASFSPGRIQVGTVSGLIGIGVLQWLSMHGIGRAIRPGPLRNLAEASAAAFAVSGVLTHLSCGMVILAYQQAATDVASTAGARPSPPSATRLFGISAVGSLGALALFSSSLMIAALRRRLNAPIVWSMVTPFPCVLTTLLTFGALPAPVGGYLRPASISTGLLTFFAVAAATAEH